MGRVKFLLRMLTRIHSKTIYNSEVALPQFHRDLAGNGQVAVHIPVYQCFVRFIVLLGENCKTVPCFVGKGMFGIMFCNVLPCLWATRALC